MNDSVNLSKNDSENRYELRVGDELIGQIDYRKSGNVVDMHHTEVNPAHGGKGYGNRLVEYALSDARENNLRVTPSCPFISKFIERHPDYEDLKHVDTEGDASGWLDSAPGGTMGVSHRPS